MPESDPLSEIVCVHGESFVVSGASGDIVPGGDLGVYVRDTRFLNRLDVRIDGTEPSHLSGASIGGHLAVFHAHVPHSAPDDGVDATLLVTRRRLVDGGLREEVAVANHGSDRTDVIVTVTVGTDFAHIFDVKHGRVLPQAQPLPGDATVSFVRDGGTERVDVHAEGASVHGCVLTVPLTIEPGDSGMMTLEVSARDVYGQVTAPQAAAAPLVATAGDVATAVPDAPRVHCSETRFARLVRRSLADLRSLQVTDPDDPTDRFTAAGSPWFLTLFGRDSIWTAFMALPFDLDLAGGTLRTLARRQGRRLDPGTEEQPGKILHEVRRGALAERGDLPPFYYGSIDATPLFVVLAHEAWCWGLPDRQVSALLPHVEAALDWMVTYGDPDGDGFLEYRSHDGRGLANQGWKDSHDGIRFADGTIARAPLALCEVQGYAYEAAVRGAELLERFGRPGAEQWRTWARELRLRFRERFWAEDGGGRYPAVALDGDKRRVDSVTSNMGHLLGTGLLDPDETATVASRLADPDLACGWGLRTLSRRSGGYNPLSYHCGSVWPHDTAIAAWGMARHGHAAAADTLIRGLVHAAPRFNFRLPELFAGLSSEETPIPVPYPASCRPQAWAAGGALLLVRALLGLDARVPDGRIVIRPLRPLLFDHLEIAGLPVAGGWLTVELRGTEVRFDAKDVAADVVVDDSPTPVMHDAAPIPPRPRPGVSP